MQTPGRSFEYWNPFPRQSGRLRFAPDGKGVVYPTRDKGIDELWLQPLDGGPGHQLTRFTTLKILS
jgi:hypothetical protein